MKNKERVGDGIDTVRQILGAYSFTPPNEDRLQAQVAAILGESDRVRVLGREVIAARGRYDILVEVDQERIVLELKVRRCPAAAVERQAQRYALTDGIDAVAVVTTSSILVHALGGMLANHLTTLGGKPFGVIYLHPF